MKGSESGINIRLFTKRKAPKIMGEVINDDKIITKTGSARNWGCP
jgi:hypothetical protein